MIAALRERARARLAELAAESDAVSTVLTELADGLAPGDAALLGQVYESLLDESARRTGGCHYTPPELAREVARHALAPLLDGASVEQVLAMRVVDPAVGGGAMLLASLEVLAAWLAARGVDSPRAAAARCLHGIDVDPVAASVAALAIATASGLAAAGIRRRIVTGDALLDEPLPAPFDAVVTNPPYLGGSYITGAYGAAYRAALVRRVAGGQRGNADLCAYFLLRIVALLRPGGCAGVIATHAVAEGSSRRIGLEQVLHSAAIYRAERRRWPGEAATDIALIWLRRGAAPGGILDGVAVGSIDSRLRPAPAVAAPARLASQRGRAFNGTKIYGQGFLLTSSEAAGLDCPEIIRPYLSGSDVLGRPDQSASRSAICFGGRTLAEAEAYPVLLARVRERVKPERDKLAGRNAIGDARAAAWWRFGTQADGLYAALAGRETCWVRVIHSHTHEFCLVPASQVFSHALAVLVDVDDALVAALQSGLHEAWATAWGSRLGDAPRYTLSRTFETFAPPVRDAGQAEALHAYLTCRQELCGRRGIGLTALRRLVDDPACQDDQLTALRQRQTELDQAVANAYGWHDLDCRRTFRESAGRPRFALSERTATAALNRLYALCNTSGVRY